MSGESMIDKVKGNVKETVGKVTGDKEMQAEGVTDQAKGSVKGFVSDVKDAAKGVKNSLDEEKSDGCGCGHKH